MSEAAEAEAAAVLIRPFAGPSPGVFSSTWESKHASICAAVRGWPLLKPSGSFSGGRRVVGTTKSVRSGGVTFSNSNSNLKKKKNDEGEVRSNDDWGKRGKETRTVIEVLHNGSVYIPKIKDDN